MLKRKNSMPKYLVTVFFLCISSFFLGAEPVYLASQSIYVYPPEGFTLLSEDSLQSTFVLGDEILFYQIHRDFTELSLFDYKQSVLQRLEITENFAEFTYMNKPAYMGVAAFVKDGFHFEGIFLFCRTDSANWFLGVFGEQDDFSNFSDFALSTLDASFFHQRERGPVSTFLSNSYAAREKDTQFVDFHGYPVMFEFYKEDMHESVEFIEREARILSVYQNDAQGIAAMKRFYRMIYRDTYSTVLDFARELRPLLNGNDHTNAAALLSWLQQHYYYRPDSLSDFTAPLKLILNSKGDCDSRALVLSMLLHSFGIDSIVLISIEYQHALGGIAVQNSGAHYLSRNQKYLIAETTDTVDMGLINRDMADPAHWIPIHFD